MIENLKLARLYLLMLAIFAVGRWLMGVRHVPYERGNAVFSLVTLTVLASVFYAAFTRRWRNFGILRAVLLAVTLAVIGQLVIIAATALSYSLQMETYFNHPIALNAKKALGMGEAMSVRAGGLVANCIINAVAGALGWAMGGVLPKR